MNKKIIDINKIFGSRVKEARINKGFSQEKFAEMLGIGVSTLSKIECAKSYPTPDTMNKIINTLEIEPYLLFMDSNQVDSEKMYKLIISKIKDLKANETKLKVAYDFIMQLK